jgi:uncharacterized protein
MDELYQKHKKLEEMLRKLDSLIVAFSGGVDSALLLKVAHDVLQENVLAVTADSPSVPRRELEEAKRFAASIRARHCIISTEEMSLENYVANPTNRCYFCKRELYSKLVEVAKREKIKFIANGTNLDDLEDYRPGLQAAAEFHVISPLKDGRLTKADVRALAQRLHLQVWDKPASPCLSSRIPYGSKVTLHKLAMIEAAEEFLKGLGIRELRVRHFGNKARIEVNRGDFEIITQNLRSIKEQFETLRFNDVELAEFQSGALNALSNFTQANS